MLRASIIGVLVALISTAGHALGGIGHHSSHINLWATLAIGFAATLIAGAIADKELTFKHLFVLIASVQLFAHIALSMGSSGHSTSHQAAGGHHGPQTIMSSSVQSYSFVPSASDIAMFLGHIAAAALIAWILATGEALWFRMHKQISGFIKVLLGYGAPSSPAAVFVVTKSGVTRSRRDHRPLGKVCQHLASEPWRGPPVSCAH